MNQKTPSPKDSKESLRERIKTFQFNEHQGIELSDDHLDYIMAEVEAYVREEKEDSYYRGINHAASDLLRHNRDLTLRRLTGELEQYAERRRQAYESR
jgi:hypothetical protein